MMSMAKCSACDRPTPLEELASEEMCTACCHKAFGLTGLDADWDKEAERLFARLNVVAADGNTGGKHTDLDVIWQDVGTGARVYIGNRRAATTRKILEPCGINAIVNCQDLASANSFEGRESARAIEYLRLNVQHWPDEVAEEGNERGAGVLDYFSPCFDWIDKSLERGESVLIHCYAGAHRAGTVGVAFLMYAARLRLAEALRLAQRCRPIINPFARLLKLLRMLELALEDARHYAAVSLPIAGGPPPISLSARGAAQAGVVATPADSVSAILPASA
ncbi:hypothetical protein KFE25_013592 [Diacronema lutheri]|uniref:protein-tyrosine-phosphatase n=1 Tax=Diacronema lutheri TaxID=2081491 RepID=A0A8J5XQL9_DIALT|nr:hypothetical protein KFE25_013592 [Diacronema lutheri]